MKNIKIVIGEDHKLVREAWTNFLNDDERFEVIASSGDAAEIVNIVKTHRPDIVLMDINLAPFSGIEATKKIHVAQPQIRIIGVSVYTQPVYVKRMLQMGAMGYITKNSPKEEMVTAILEVNKGNKYICTEVKNIMAENMLEENENDIDKLTSREIEIINLIKIGKSSKEIGEFLNIALKTVEVHRHNILKKLKLSNSSAMVNFINAADRYF